MLKNIVCGMGCVAFLTFNASAVEFDLRDTTVVAEIESGIVTRGGITATLIPIVDGNTGVLNQTRTGFGINATGSADETSRLDGDEGVESVSIVFDVDVLWTGLALSVFSGSEGASLSLPSSTAIALADTGSGNDVYVFTSDNVVLIGESVVVSWVSGNGFSFDSFTVEKYEAPTGSSVPDGGLSAVLLITGLGLVSAYRRRVQSH